VAYKFAAKVLILIVLYQEIHKEKTVWQEGWSHSTRSSIDRKLKRTFHN